MKRKMIIGHRGSYLATGNTIEAFEKAIEVGCDMVEFDIRKTKDGELVIYHDEQIDGKILAEFTYEEMNQIAAKHQFRMPTYKELLETCQGKIKLDIELKESGYEEEAIELTLKYFKKEDFVITSFKKETVIFVRENFPEIECGLIVGDGSYADNSKNQIDGVELIRQLKESSSSFAPISWEVYSMNKEFFRNWDKDIVVWTINDSAELLKAISDEKITGIITGRPDLAFTLV